MSPPEVPAGGPRSVVAASGGLHPAHGAGAVERAVARAAAGGARWVALAVHGEQLPAGDRVAAAHGVFLMLARPDGGPPGRPPEAAVWSPHGRRLAWQVSAVAGGPGAGPAVVDIDGWPCGLLLGEDVRAPEVGRLLQLRGALCLWCAPSPSPMRGGCASLAGVWSLVQQTQCFALEAAAPPGLSAVHAPCEITPGGTGFLAAADATVAAAATGGAGGGPGGAAGGAPGAAAGRAAEGAASPGSAADVRNPLGDVARVGTAIPGLAAARLDPAALGALRAAYDLRAHLNPLFYRRHMPGALLEPAP